jgi:uncharacterized protein YndB with AHSA1/START domain
MAAVTSDRTAKVTFPADEQILITRELDAPRHLVYKAWTTPELVRHWWTGERGEMTTVEIDLRVGGRWRYVMTTEDGGEVAFSGEYREIIPNERIVYTEVFEGTPDVQALTAVTFTEAAGQTTLAILIRYGSGQERDAHSAYRKDGMEEALDLLGGTAKALARR